MANIALEKNSISSIASQIERMISETENSKNIVYRTMQSLDFEVSSKKNIQNRLSVLNRTLLKQTELGQKYKTVFINITDSVIGTDNRNGKKGTIISNAIRINNYKPTSNVVRDFLIHNNFKKVLELLRVFTGHTGGMYKQPFDDVVGVMASAMIGTVPLILYEAMNNKSFDWVSDFINNKLKTDGSILYGKIEGDGEVLGFDSSGSLSGSVLSGKAGIKNSSKLTFKDEDGNWDFKKFGISTKASASGSVASGEAKGNIGYLHGSASGEALTGGVSGEAECRLFDDGTFNPSLNLKAKAEGSVLKGEADLGFGSEEYGIDAKASGEVLHAEAEAGAGVGYIGTNKDGVAQYGAQAKASAMASLAEGKVEGGVTIFGIDIDVGVKGYAGAVGVEAGGSITTDGVTGSFGGALGFGGKLDVSIDWSDAEWLGDSIEATGKVIAGVNDVVSDVVDNVGDVFEDIGDFFSSNLNWF